MSMKQGGAEAARRSGRDPAKQRANAQRHYERNRAAIIERAKAHKRTTRVQMRAFVAKFLSANPCVDCGEADPIVLEFDHVRGTKSFNIGDASRLGVGWQRLRDEIAKCDVRCANCHRRRTHAGSTPAPATKSHASSASNVPLGATLVRPGAGCPRRRAVLHARAS